VAADNGSILVTGAAGQLGAVGRTVTGLLLDRGLPVRAMVRREDDRAAALQVREFVSIHAGSGLLVTRLAAPPIAARNERLEDPMMVRADIDRTWQIDGCRADNQRRTFTLAGQATSEKGEWR
jgi:nucleoside-diphosphate-sugar epimerase